MGTVIFKECAVKKEKFRQELSVAYPS